MTIGARLGGRGVNLVVFLVLARTLPLDELGLYGYAFTSALLLCSAFDFGVRNSVAYYVGREQARSPHFARLTITLWAGMAVPASFAAAIAVRLGAPQLFSPAYIIPVLILVVSMLFLRMGQGVLLGDGRLGFYNQTELATRLLLAISTGALLAVDEITLSTALWSLALAQFGGALILAHGLLLTSTPDRWWDASDATVLLRRGVFFMLAVLLMTAAKRISFIVLSVASDASAMGRFYGVLRLTEIITEVALAIAVVVFSENVRAASGAEAIDTAAHSTRVSLALFLAMAVVAHAFADSLLPLALGESFIPDIASFRLVLWGTLAGCVWTILFPSYSAIDTPQSAILVFLPNVAFALLITWSLTSRYGVEGAAGAYLIANLVLSASFLAMFRRRHGARIGDFLFLRREDLAPVLTAARLLRNRMACRHSAKSD